MSQQQFRTVVLQCLPAVLVLALCSQSLKAQQIYRTSGGVESGQLLSIDDQGNSAYSIQGKDVSITRRELFRFGSPRFESDFDQLLFSDGSVIACVVKKISAGQVAISSRVFQNQTIPSEYLDAIVFKQKPAARGQQLTRDEAARQRFTARVKLDNDDVVSGELMESTAEETLVIDNNGVTQSLPFSKISVLFLANGDRKPEITTPKNGVGFKDGTLLKYNQLSVGESTIRFQMHNGLQLVASATIRNLSLWNRACYYEPAPQTFKFLSDEEPLRVVDSKSKLFLKTRFNRSTAGGPLVSRGKYYLHGIGTRPTSQIVYRIGEKDREFRATVSIDDTGSKQASCICRILLLRDNKWETAAQPFTVNRANPPIDLKLKVAGYRAIAMVTSSGLHGIVGDRLNWLDARILE